MNNIQAWAALNPKQALQMTTIDLDQLDHEEIEAVDITVIHYGICHSDVSMMNNDWGFTTYPLFFDGAAHKIRAHWIWIMPLPQTLNKQAAGPLFCGNITVFAPLRVFDLKSIHHMGALGRGDLGDLGVKFAIPCECAVTALTTCESKIEETKHFGVHNVMVTQNNAARFSIKNTFDWLLITVNAPLDWSTLLKTFKRHGRMHVVGAVLEPMAIPAMDLMFAQKSVSGSPSALNHVSVYRSSWH